MSDDKYLGLTAYLRKQHTHGNNFFALSFQEINELSGFSTEHLKQCSNNCFDPCALGWLLADYVMLDCSSQKQEISFQYNPDKAESLFLLHSVS